MQLQADPDEKLTDITELHLLQDNIRMYKCVLCVLSLLLLKIKPELSFFLDSSSFSLSRMREICTNTHSYKHILTEERRRARRTR